MANSLIPTILRTLPVFAATWFGPPSDSWAAGSLLSLLGPDAWSYHNKQIKKFGKTFKFTGMMREQALYTFDPKAMHHIFVKDQHLFPETDEFIRGMYQLLGPAMTAVGGQQAKCVYWASWTILMEFWMSAAADHSRHRRLLTPVFSVAHLREIAVPLFGSVSFSTETNNNWVLSTCRLSIPPITRSAALQFFRQPDLSHLYALFSLTRCRCHVARSGPPLDFNSTPTDVLARFSSHQWAPWNQEGAGRSGRTGEPVGLGRRWAPEVWDGFRRVALQHRDGVNDDEGFMEEARAAFECAWDHQQNVNEGGHDIPREVIHPVRWKFATTFWNKLAFPKPMDNRKGNWVELAVRDTIRTAQRVLAGQLERVDQKLPCHLAPPSVPKSIKLESSRRLPPILLHHSPPAHPEFIPHPTPPHLEPKPLKVDPQFRTPIRHVSFHHSLSANPQSFPIPHLDPKSLKVEPQFRTPIRQRSFRTATIGLGDSDSDSESGDRPARDDGEVFTTSEMSQSDASMTLPYWVTWACI
ncbi:hypothetical protein D9611_001250 [Ephemerocybe angulata]|uniref:Uncharacterized protein n=1 Tax=Ephemerocybe angulata TaxID=980116 RepID=A0A8H5CIK4_9AGAR|nr:hypothetical protein D9611_001250 [Tulosesus angulatus]